jgi:hypothetical protein
MNVEGEESADESQAPDYQHRWLLGHGGGKLAMAVRVVAWEEARGGVKQVLRGSPFGVVIQTDAPSTRSKESKRCLLPKRNLMVQMKGAQLRNEEAGFMMRIKPEENMDGP